MLPPSILASYWTRAECSALHDEKIACAGGKGGGEGGGGGLVEETSLEQVLYEAQGGGKG